MMYIQKNTTNNFKVKLLLIIQIEGHFETSFSLTTIKEEKKSSECFSNN